MLYQFFDIFCEFYWPKDCMDAYYLANVWMITPPMMLISKQKVFLGNPPSLTFVNYCVQHLLNDGLEF